MSFLTFGWIPVWIGLAIFINWKEKKDIREASLKAMPHAQQHLDMLVAQLHKDFPDKR